jgi:phage tail P2-like protein
MTLDLLPENATPLEQELTLLSAELELIDPAVIETIWDAWRCPGPMLPWLAWALSVDVWDDGWGEIVKRQAIADSPYYHRIKGTVRAVRSALALALRPYELTEWFDHIPAKRRGTATIFVETTLDDIPRILRAIRPLAMAAKPKSRALAFGAGELVPGFIGVGGGLFEDSLTTVDPYAYPGEDVDGAMRLGGGLLDETLITIEAHA